MATITYPVDLIRQMSERFITLLGLTEGEPAWLTLVGGPAADRYCPAQEMKVRRRVLTWNGWTDQGMASWRRVGDQKVVFLVPPAGSGFFKKSRIQLAHLAMCANAAGPVSYVWPESYQCNWGGTVTIENRIITAGVVIPTAAQEVGR